VYDVNEDGERTLVAAMFLRLPGSRRPMRRGPAARSPRWHEHGDLCLATATPRPSADSPMLPDLPEGHGAPAPHAGRCTCGSSAHPCGPFAELEGVGDPGPWTPHG
jgi:hypothetical protein